MNDPYSNFPLQQNQITYCMACPQGRYVAHSWISLGWAILRHRIWHLFKHGRWMD